MLDDGLAFSDMWIFRFSSDSREPSLIQIPGLITCLLPINQFHDKRQERGYGQKYHTRQ